MRTIALLLTMLAQAPVAPGPMATPPGWMPETLRAEALAKDGKHLEAAGVYERYSATQPWFPAAHYLRVGHLLAAGRADLVAAALATARRQIPKDPPMRAEAAMFVTSLADTPGLSRVETRRLLDEALALTDEALAINPRFGDALRQKASTLEAR